MKESEVRQISADLSTFLKFARPTAKDPVWKDLLTAVLTVQIKLVKLLMYVPHTIAVH